MSNFCISYEPDEAIRETFQRRLRRVVRMHRRQHMIDQSAGRMLAVFAHPSAMSVRAARFHHHVYFQIGHLFWPDRDVSDDPFPSLARRWRIGLGDRLPPIPDGYGLAARIEDSGETLISPDCFGVFPVYYWGNRERLVIASSPASILQHPLFSRKLDEQGLAGILLTNGLVAGRTLLQGITRLAPRSMLRWFPGSDPRQQGVAPAFSSRLERRLSRLSRNRLFDELDRGIHRATARALRHASAPVTALLSGGADSRMVAAYACRLQRTPECALTMGKPTDYDAFSAAEAVKALGISRHELIEPDPSELKNDIKRAAYYDGLAGGMSNHAWLWQIGEALASTGSSFVSGLFWDMLFVISKYAVFGARDSYPDYLQRNLAWGVTAETLHQLFGEERGREAVEGVYGDLEAMWKRWSLVSTVPSYHTTLENRNRLHVGNAFWILGQFSAPVSPAFDQKLLLLLRSLPRKVLQEDIRLPLLCHAFPGLADVVVDKTESPPRSFLSPEGPDPDLPPLSEEQARDPDARMVYSRLFRFSNHAGWRELWRQTLAEREGDGLLSTDRLEACFPDPVLLPSGSQLNRSAPVKNLIGLHLWQRLVRPQVTPASPITPASYVPGASPFGGLFRVEWRDRTRDGDQEYAEYHFRTDRWSGSLWFARQDNLPDFSFSDDVIFPVALVMAMASEAGILELPGPVSPRLLGSAPRIQALFREIHPRLEEVVIRAGERPTIPRERSPGRMAFFTGGVDSCFTCWENREELSGLVYVCGFDVAVSDRHVEEVVLSGIRRMAGSLGLPLHVVRTNLRTCADRFTLWGEMMFGAALASVAHLLAERAGIFYLAASYDHETLQKCGSMPELDPLWSSECVEIVHHGAESSRSQKIRTLAAWPEALENLRVCWKNTGGAYNCGRCEKCLRTMVELILAGLLQKAHSFPQTVDPDSLRGLEMDTTLVLSHWVQLRREWQAQDPGHPLIAAIEEGIRRNRARFGRHDPLP